MTQKLHTCIIASGIHMRLDSVPAVPLHHGMIQSKANEDVSIMHKIHLPSSRQQTQTQMGNLACI